MKKIMKYLKNLFVRKRKLTEREKEMEEFLSNIASLPNVTVIKYTIQKEKKRKINVLL